MTQKGKRHPSEYQRITAEVYYDASRRKNGVCPCPDQGFPTDIKIECSKEIRNYPIGTKARLNVVETNK